MPSCEAPDGGRQCGHQNAGKKLGLAKSTVSYHIARLESAGLLLVEPHGVRLREPERVRNLLLRWRPPTDATERFASLWRSFYRAGHG